MTGDALKRECQYEVVISYAIGFQIIPHSHDYSWSESNYSGLNDSLQSVHELFTIKLALTS